MRLILIIWNDANSRTHEWDDLSIFDTELSLCKSVGWVTAEDEKAITIVSSIQDDEHGGGDITIPRGCIISITELDNE